MDGITIAPLSRAETDLTDVALTFGHVRAAARLAGPEAFCSARIEIHCASPAEVDTIAAQWGVPARWSGDGVHYSAERVTGRTAAEAVFFGPRPAQDAAVSA
jgi:hypothetical protein